MDKSELHHGLPLFPEVMAFQNCALFFAVAVFKRPLHPLLGSLMGVSTAGEAFALQEE